MGKGASVFGSIIWTCEGDINPGEHPPPCGDSGLKMGRRATETKLILTVANQLPSLYLARAFCSMAEQPISDFFCDGRPRSPSSPRNRRVRATSLLNNLVITKTGWKWKLGDCSPADGQEHAPRK
jgi:hypothetical protein